jgi:hypothetical protein
VKLAMGAGSGGGISGISTSGVTLRGFAGFALRAGLGARRGLAARLAVGFARLGFALRALVRFAFPAFEVFRPAFRDAFAMTAYATGGSGRRQPRRGGA